MATPGVNEAEGAQAGEISLRIILERPHASPAAPNLGVVDVTRVGSLRGLPGHRSHRRRAVKMRIDAAQLFKVGAFGAVLKVLPALAPVFEWGACGVRWRVPIPGGLR